MPLVVLFMRLQLFGSCQHKMAEGILGQTIAATGTLSALKVKLEVILAVLAHA
jgi:hypothetical protein